MRQSIGLAVIGDGSSRFILVGADPSDSMA